MDLFTCLPAATVVYRRTNRVAIHFHATPPRYGKRGCDVIERLLLAGYAVPSESMLIAHVHAEFLRISTIAFLYYHSICLKCSQSDSGPVASRGSCRGVGMLSWTTAQRRKIRLFYKQHGLGPCDAEIIEYLADVVKRQQVASHSAAMGRAIRESANPNWATGYSHAIFFGASIAFNSFTDDLHDDFVTDPTCYASVNAATTPIRPPLEERVRIDNETGPIGAS